jgi:hypothetical protein
VSFAAITLCVASQRVFIVVVYFVIDCVRKLLDTPSYCDSMYFCVIFIHNVAIGSLCFLDLQVTQNV